MTPQAAAFLAKGDKALREGRAMLEAGFNEAAGRAAYLVAFHAAQARDFAAEALETAVLFVGQVAALIDVPRGT